MNSLEDICKQHDVKELYVFGSAAEGKLRTESDLDFLVVFNREGYKGAFDQFMGLKEDLESYYARPIDLVVYKEFRNPVFREEVERSKKLLYAA